MANPLGCAHILGSGPSLLASSARTSAPKPPSYARPSFPNTTHRLITVWTDGSAHDNGSELCVAGSAWFSDASTSEYAHIVDSIIPTNNVAKVVAVIMALQAWSLHDLHIITDSSFVIRLFEGGLLAMERDGWPNLPLSQYGNPFSLASLLQHLLYLACCHNAFLRISWVKGHSGDYGNSRADELALLGINTQHFPFDVTTLTTPPGWVDTLPVLNSQSLASLTYAIVRHYNPPPIFGLKFSPFCVSWMLWVYEHFHTYLDISKHFSNLWTINIPTSLCRLLWKAASGSLPIRCHFYSTSNLGCTCCCGSPQSLGHMWGSCPSYNLSPLLDLLCQKLDLLCTTYSRTLSPYEWKYPYWYLILAFKPLETLPDISKKCRQSFGDSRRARKWAIGSFFWYIWKVHMKEIFEDKKFIPLQHVHFMCDILELPALSEATPHTPVPVHPSTDTSVIYQAPPAPRPCPSCRDANYFHIWRTLMHTPTPPYAPMPPTPPASPSPLLLPANMLDMDITLLPAHA